MQQHLTRGLFLAGALLATAPAALAAQTEEQPLRAVLANGYRFTYLERGAGRAVVLVHDELADYRMWEALGVELADTARVIAYSRRYHFPNPRRSGDPPADLATHGGDLAAILHALHLEQAVLVADGRAAAIAVRAALRAPGLVAGVVLVEPRLGPPLGDSLPPDSVGAESVPSTHTLENILPETLRGPARPLTCDELRRLEVPLLLLGAEGGSRNVAAGIEGSRRCVPAATVELLPGRDLADTAAATLARVLARFLAALPR